MHVRRPDATRKRRRSRVEVTLARFEAMDPATLDPEQCRYRDFAIRALRIELELRARGLVDGAGAPGAPAGATDAGPAPRVAPAKRQRARSTRRT